MSTGDLQLPCLHHLIAFRSVCHSLLEKSSSSALRMSAEAPDMKMDVNNNYMFEVDFPAKPLVKGPRSRYFHWALNLKLAEQKPLLL